MLSMLYWTNCISNVFLCVRVYCLGATRLVCVYFHSSLPNTTPSLLLASPLRISRKPSFVKNSSL